MSVASRRIASGVVLALSLLAASCSGSSPAATRAHRAQPVKTAGAVTFSPATTAASSTTSATTGPDAPTTPRAAYAVGSRTMTVVDTTRPTVGDPKRHIPASKSRTLPLFILYPATGSAASATPKSGAPIAPGRFPIVEFSHGVTANGPVYAAFIESWAAAGYVVVAPTFPMTSGNGAWGDLGDYVNQPADAGFALTKVIALNAKAGDPFRGHLATSALAVAGHSLGAITTLGFYNSCCHDARIEAAISISGTQLPFPRGTWANPPKTPLLLVHGQKDGTVPYRGSTMAFASLTGPRALLTEPSGTHVGVIFGPKLNPVTVATTIAFLDLELRHDPTRWNALAKSIPASGVASIKEAGGLPAPGHA